MPVSTVGWKNPFAGFVTRLSGHLFRSGRADWTKLCTALRVREANAAGFGVEPGPGQCEHFAAAASGEQQHADGSHAGAVRAVGRSLSHSFTESGEFVERQEAPALVVGETPNAARGILEDHAVPFGKF